MQTNNDMVHKLQDAQREQKISLEQLTCQMTQLATSINDLCGNGGGIPAQVQNPRKEYLNQVTLRSGREVKGPTPIDEACDQGETSNSGEGSAEGEDCPIRQIAQSDSEDGEEMDKHIIVKPIGIIHIPPRENPKKATKEKKRVQPVQKLQPPYPGRLERRTRRRI